MTDQELAHIIKHNTRVILPNFGAFLQKKNDDGQFNINELTFSSFLRYNDNFLEAQIARLRGCSIDEAANEVSQYIGRIQQTLASQGSYTIDNLGSLAFGDNHQVLFSTDIPTTTILNYTPEPSPAPEPTPESLPKPTPKTDETTSTSTPPPVPAKPKDKSKIAHSPQKKVEPQPQRTSWSKRLLATLIFVVVSVAIIMGIAYLIRYTVFAPQVAFSDPDPIVQPNNSKPSTETNSTQAPKDDMERTFERMASDPATPQTAKQEKADKTNAPKTSTPQKADTKAEPKSEPKAEQQQKATNTPKTAPSTSTEAQFYLIVGSFKERSNADKLASEMKQNSLSAVVVERNNGSFIVSLGTYTTREQANEAKQKYTNQFPAAWIMSSSNE